MDESPVDLSHGEFEMHLALDERAERRPRLIMVVGSIFSFMLYPVCAVAGAWAFDEVGEAAGWVIVSLLPLMLGAMISFLGMTMADYCRNVGEWGVRRPSRCLLHGSVPLALTLVFPPAFIIVTGASLGMWLLMILGGWMAAEIVERSRAVKF